MPSVNERDRAEIEITEEMVESASKVYFEWAGDTISMSEHASGEAPAWIRPMLKAAIAVYCERESKRIL